MPGDIFSLLSDDEPSAQEHARAMIAALRGQQAMGQLGQLTGDKVLAPFGQSLEQGAQQQQGQLLQAGEHRLTAAMASRKLAQESANEGEQRRLQEMQIKQTGAYQRGELNSRADALDAAKFQQLSPGHGLFNSKTGEMAPGVGIGGMPLHPQDAAKFDAILNGVDAIDHIKAAKKSGILPGFGEYDATLKAEVPALAAADSGTGRASGQGDILKRAPNLYSAAGDTLYDTDRERYLSTAQGRLSALKQAGYNVAEQESRLARYGAQAAAGVGAGGSAGGVRKFTRVGGNLVEVK